MSPLCVDSDAKKMTVAVKKLEECSYVATGIGGKTILLIFTNMIE
jgi:hypothetical protein